MDIKSFVIAYKNIIMLGIGVIAIFALLITLTVPKISNTSKLKNDYKNAQNALADKEKLLEDLKLQEKQAKEEAGPKKLFFKGIDKGLDTESVIANEFGEIILILRSNSIKARSVSYEYDPQDDTFVKNAGNQYNVAKLRIEMIGTYKNFEGFLRDLFKHEHFLDIVSLDIVPYEKNKKILIINMQLKLYAQKD